jgi:general stress protein 26
MADQNDYWIEEQALSQIDPDLVDKWGDPNKHPETQLTQEEQRSLLEAGREMFLTHLTKDGFPMVTVHVYVVRDGELWSTSVKGRVKVKALQTDPRCGVCISSSGLTLPFGGAMTMKTRVEIIEDRACVEEICRLHGERYYASPKARELFTRSLFTPNRVAMRFHIDRVVSWKNVGARSS